MFEKDPEIDIAAEHGRCSGTGLHLAERAYRLMYCAFIARQRHHLAQRRQLVEKLPHTRFDPLGTFPAMGGHELRLGNTEVCRKVAFAHLRVIETCPPYFVRRRFDALVHYPSPTKLTC